jgi:hypothetical protein
MTPLCDAVTILRSRDVRHEARHFALGLESFAIIEPGAWKRSQAASETPAEKGRPNFDSGPGDSQGFATSKRLGAPLLARSRRLFDQRFRGQKRI